MNKKFYMSLHPTKLFIRSCNEKKIYSLWEGWIFTVPDEKEFLDKVILDKAIYSVIKDYYYTSWEIYQ